MANEPMRYEEQGPMPAGTGGLERVPADRDAIGGYFGLEPTSAPGRWPWPAGLLFQSARAAFAAWLEFRAPRVVWLPWFICGAMLEPLRRHGVEIRRYALTADFRIVSPPPLGAGEVLLYVNHFGLCDAIERELEAAYPRECLVFDHAQALYASPGGAATIYSPRKFLGVADGGILVTADAVPAPVRTDPGSEGRLQARMLRTARGAEAGFQAFREAEASLDGQPPLAMSALTRRVLAAVDHDRVAGQRRRNFEFVHAALARHNRLRLALRPGQVPLCYPLWPRRAVPRAALHHARIYVPTYWPELLEAAQTPPAERCWAAEWLHLPIDQRYDPACLQAHVTGPLAALLANR